MMLHKTLLSPQGWALKTLSTLCHYPSFKAIISDGYCRKGLSGIGNPMAFNSGQDLALVSDCRSCIDMSTNNSPETIIVRIQAIQLPVIQYFKCFKSAL